MNKEDKNTYYALCLNNEGCEGYLNVGEVYKCTTNGLGGLNFDNYINAPKENFRIIYNSHYLELDKIKKEINNLVSFLIKNNLLMEYLCEDKGE